MKLEGKVALITGAGRRIGRAIALDLAERGCHVALHFHRSEEEAAETAGLIESRGCRTALLQADLGDAEAAGRLAGRAAEALGSLSILVNNASTFDQMELESFTVDAWNRTLAVNLTAPMILCRTAAPYLRRAAPGRIVNLGDISAERPWTDHLAYCVSKAGLACLTQALAKALAPDIHVNAVAPGAAVFPEDYPPEKIKAITRRVPAMRAGSAEDVAAAVRFLIEEADYVTGTTLAVDGGCSIAW